MSLIDTISKKFMDKGRPVVITDSDVYKALSVVMDPDLGRDIVSLGFVRNLVIGKDNSISLDVNLTTPACPVKDLLKAQAVSALESIPGAGKISVQMTAVRAQKKSEAATEVSSSLARVENIIAVAAGKGGVGKSTTSVSLAYALKQLGAKVGILDADIYGPSIPLMTGAAKPTEMQGKMISPPECDGIKVVSISMFSSPEQAQILRGPMAGNVVKQFLTQVAWGELDYLIIDYPP